MSEHIAPRLRKATAGRSFMSVSSGLLERKCACVSAPGPSECEACRWERPALEHRDADPSESVTVPPIVHEVLRSEGQQLDPTTRAFMEPRFGHDFGRVRVHTDATAAESARAVKALAYTVGPDIVFGARQYAPETDHGRKLLAHELVHVIQQGQIGALNPRAASISNARDSSELEAERIATGIIGSSSAASRGEQAIDSNRPQWNGASRSVVAHTDWTGPRRISVATDARLEGLIQRQPTHPDPDCEDLLAQVIARLVELKERAGALIRNPLNLPQSGPMSVEGHQQQFQNKQTNLRSMLNQWDTNNCGPGYMPSDAWEWATRPVPRPASAPSESRTTVEPPKDGSRITPGEVAAVAGVAVGGYVLYRVVRMLPSLLPPLWWTIPANVAVP